VSRVLCVAAATDTITDDVGGESGAAALDGLRWDEGLDVTGMPKEGTQGDGDICKGDVDGADEQCWRWW
jgi:hypothetical protein